MAATKPTMNIVFVGHVDHGKSTCVGQLMFQSGIVPEQEMKKLKEEAIKLGKPGFEFAYVMDKIKEERERGVTIDLAYRKIVTPKRQVTIIDAPGHKDFVKNMITGASQADAAFLTIAAKEGVQPQTKEHLWLLRTMGVQEIAILINKMDTAEYKEESFNKVKSEVSALLKVVGINPEKTTFLAVSGLKGDNIKDKSANMPWYKGPTLYEQLDLFSEPKKPTDLPMRMPVQDVYEITGIGTVPVGKIETGIMKVGQKIIVLPGRSGRGITGEVKSIEMHHETIPEALAGDNVGINIVTSKSFRNSFMMHLYCLNLASNSCSCSSRKHYDFLSDFHNSCFNFPNRHCSNSCNFIDILNRHSHWQVSRKLWFRELIKLLKNCCPFIPWHVLRFLYNIISL